MTLRTVHDSISTLEDHFTKLPLTPAMIQNPFLTAQSTQIKSVISVPIKDFIHHYPRALFNDIPRVGAHFYDIPGSGRTFTTYPGHSPAMKRHVMSARMRYGQYLDEQKKESLNEQQRKKRRGVQLSIRGAERKKSKVDTSIDILGKEADDLAKPAEAKHDFTLLTKSNAPRLKVAQ